MSGQRSSRKTATPPKALQELAIPDTATEAILSVGVDGRIVQANRAAETMFGYNRDELLNIALESLFPERFRGTCAEQRDRYRLAAPVGPSLKLTGLRKDGVEFPIASAWDWVPGKDKTLAIDFISDLSERRNTQDSLDERDRQALLAQLARTQEEVRRRISRELHDDLTQRLATLAVDIGRIARQSLPSKAVLKATLRSLQRRAVEATETARHVAHELHPLELDDLGLVAALRSYCQDFSNREGIAVHLESRDVPKGLKREIGSCVYNVVKESLTNVAKHA
jgi:PAS domain S-box-containing protein